MVGLDPDPEALALARCKADRAGLSIRFDQGFSEALPYPDMSFDRVFSSFMLHHLAGGVKETTIREVRRVLTASGSFHLLDFSPPEDRTPGLFARLIHSHGLLKDNSEGQILDVMHRAGLAGSRRTMDGAVCFGIFRIAWYSGSAPRADDPFGTRGSAAPAKP